MDLSNYNHIFGKNNLPVLINKFVNYLLFLDEMLLPALIQISRLKKFLLLNFFSKNHFDI
jgi:hypothetical protein